MSCLHFTPDAQRRVWAAAPLGLSNEDAALLHSSPPMTESKLRRLRLLAESPVPGIRQSVAANPHAPRDLVSVLAHDRDATVRASVARAETSPPEVLQALAGDPDVQVRCWVAVNRTTGHEVVATLTDDPAAEVRSLARWRRSVEAQPAPA